MQLSNFCDRLDDRLETSAYADIDASANGLQVGPSPDAGAVGRDPSVSHVAFAVDAALETIEAAAAADADVLVTHHGLIWGGLDRVTGPTYARLEGLFDTGVALYVAHLPLDGHQELGNAAGLAEHLGVVDPEPFGSMGSETVGMRGRFRDGLEVSALADRLAADLDTDDRPVRVLDFGPEIVESIAIVTGSGVDWIGEAIEAGIDTLVTGEGKQHAYHEAREAGLNVVLAGHYATETFGVRALQELIEDWGIRTTYIDRPTGL